MQDMPFAARLVFYAFTMVPVTFIGKGPHIPGPWEIALCIGGGVLAAATYPLVYRLLRTIWPKSNSNLDTTRQR